MNRMRYLLSLAERHPWTTFFSVALFVHLAVFVFWPSDRIAAGELTMPANVVLLMNLDVAVPRVQDTEVLKVDETKIEIGQKDQDQKKTQDMRRSSEGTTFLPGFEADSKPQPLIDISSILSYPQTAFDAGIQGSVLLELDISEAGVVVNVRLVQRAGWGFDEEAVRKIVKVRFRPALKDKLPVAVTIILPVQFKIE